MFLTIKRHFKRVFVVSHQIGVKGPFGGNLVEIRCSWCEFGVDSVLGADLV
jgi:hypothetical protein